MLNNTLLTSLIVSLGQQFYIDLLAAGHFGDEKRRHVWDDDTGTLIDLIDQPESYLVNFFDSSVDLTKEQLKSFIETFPKDKPLKASLNVYCAYLIRHGEDTAERLLDAFAEAEPDSVVVKTLDDPKVKGTIGA